MRISHKSFEEILFAHLGRIVFQPMHGDIVGHKQHQQSVQAMHCKDPMVFICCGGDPAASAIQQLLPDIPEFNGQSTDDGPSTAHTPFVVRRAHLAGVSTQIRVDELVGVILSQHSVHQLGYLKDELVNVVVVESVLESQLFWAVQVSVES